MGERMNVERIDGMSTLMHMANLKNHPPKKYVTKHRKTKDSE